MKTFWIVVVVVVLVLLGVYYSKGDESTPSPLPEEPAMVETPAEVMVETDIPVIPLQ